MSDSKHTPGPWEVQPKGINETRYIIAPNDVIEWNGADIDNHVALVCVPYDGTIQKKHGQDVVEANAKLLAAAPDMLEQLQVLSYALWENTQGMNQAAWDQIYIDVQAAIAKATDQP